MKKTTTLVIVVLLLQAVFIVWVLNYKSLRIAELESQMEYCLMQKTTYLNRNMRQYSSHHEAIDLSFYTDVQSKQIVLQDTTDYFVVFFPSSACGVCHDAVLEKLRLLLEKVGHKRVFFFTDMASLNDIKVLLKNMEVPEKQLYIRSRNAPRLEVETQGNPYFFILRPINSKFGLVEVPFIPDKEDVSLSVSYFDLIYRMLRTGSTPP